MGWWATGDEYWTAVAWGSVLRTGKGRMEIGATFNEAVRGEEM